MVVSMLQMQLWALLTVTGTGYHQHGRSRKQALQLCVPRRPLSFLLLFVFEWEPAKDDAHRHYLET